MAGFSAFLRGEEEKPFRQVAGPATAKVRHELALYIAGLIRDEQNLSTVRMNWNLTFQGFTLAGYAVLAAADKTSPARFLIQIAVASFSCIVAGATLKALVASERQREYLKPAWREAELSPMYPEPFSASSGSSAGRTAARTICLSTMALWLFLGAAAVSDRDLNMKQVPLAVRVEGALAIGPSQADKPANVAAAQSRRAPKERPVKALDRKPTH